MRRIVIHTMKVVVSFRLDRELKSKMDELKHVNWSEVVRTAIRKKVEEELAKMRRVNRERVRRAHERLAELRRRVEGWSSVAEIRRWRESR